MATLEEEGRPFAGAAVKIVKNAPSLYLADDRTHRRVLVGARSDDGPSEQLAGSRHEIIEDALMDHPTSSCAAHLTGIECNRGRQRLGGLLHVHIIEDDSSALPTELELAWNKIAGSRLCNELSYPGRPGE